MLPKGLVLLISVSLANGVIRLAKMKILVQNIYSLETLAHVDTLCLDKTGTITDGKLKVCSVMPLSGLPEAEISAVIQSYMAACDDQQCDLSGTERKIPAEGVLSTGQKDPLFIKKEMGICQFRRSGYGLSWSSGTSYGIPSGKA